MPPSRRASPNSLTKSPMGQRARTTTRRKTPPRVPPISKVTNKTTLTPATNGSTAYPSPQTPRLPPPPVRPLGRAHQSSLLTSFDSVLPLFTKNTFGWNATGAGLIFLPIVVPTFAGPLIGHLSDKQGPRWYATAGFAGCTPFLILLRLVDHDSLRQKVLLCALLTLIGLFLTLALIPMMAEVTYAVMDKESRRPKGYYGVNGAYAQAYSLFNMAWAAGCMVGPLLAGLVVNSKGWPTATLILGCVSIFTALPVVIWTGGSWRKSKGRNMQAERAARMEAQT